MNGFCGAVDYKDPNIDFDILKRMSVYLGRREGRVLEAGVLPGCAIICASYGGGFAPLIKSCGGREYMAVALASADNSPMAEPQYVAESLVERYVSDTAACLAVSCSAVCAVIFNGAFGETVMLSDKASEQSIYYTRQGSTLYFSNELRAVLSVIESYEGSIKVRKSALQKHLIAPDPLGVEELFVELGCVRSGRGIILSNFGMSEFEMDGDAEDSAKGRTTGVIIPPDSIMTFGICQSAVSILDLFGYPQFDVYLPTLIDRLERARASVGAKRRWIPESVPLSSGLSWTYLTERAKILSRAYGITVRTELCSRRTVGVADRICLYRAFRYILKALNKELEDEKCILYEIFDDKKLCVRNLLKREKSIPRRVRLAGMLYQTSIWFKKYNISF